MWDDTTKQGMKMGMNALESQSDTPPMGQTGDNDTLDAWGQAYDYNCERWSTDASLFTPPKGVEFMDMNAMMKGMPTMPKGVSVPAASGAAPGAQSGMPDMQNMMAAQCAACDQAGDAREQCRAALGCK